LGFRNIIRLICNIIIVLIRCRTIQSGNLNSSFDGILGFGKSNASVLSQLASLGVKRMFAHCLDSYNMGGIFAIGHVVQPKVINSTPFIPSEEHYTSYVTGIKVGGEFLNLSNGVEKRKAVIDSGTSLVYLPDVIYKPLVNKILAVQSGMRSHVLLDNFTCIGGSISVDDELPAVTFHFENSLSLKVDPHDYMFAYRITWAPQVKRDIIVLGELILLDKLFLYDLEKQTVGWTEYNCSSSIALQDEASGLVNLVGFGSDSVSSAMSLIIHRFLIFLLLVSLPIIHAK
ncbi:aspartic proteinase-like protein 2, partial [Helianthus annuus]|uniref:aspartic proteinase-like protein 2 n=1 Tax=Helianthus annuus TaxID=4232 RepID=UPI001653146D